MLLLVLLYQSFAIPAVAVLVVFAYTIAPVIALRFGIEASTLFMGRDRHTVQPLISRAQALMKNHMYEDAFREYCTIANDFPDVLELYQPLFELAFQKLHNPEAARALYKQGWNAVNGEQRKKLEYLFNTHKKLGEANRKPL